MACLYYTLNKLIHLGTEIARIQKVSVTGTCPTQSNPQPGKDENRSFAITGRCDRMMVGGAGLNIISFSSLSNSTLRYARLPLKGRDSHGVRIKANTAQYHPEQLPHTGK